MSLSKYFSDALMKSTELGKKTLLKNGETPDTIVYENLKSPILDLYVAQEGDSALDFIFEQEKRKILRWMYGGR